MKVGSIESSLFKTCAVTEVMLRIREKEDGYIF